MFRIPTKTKLKNIVPLSQYQMWLTCSAVISTLCQISKIQATLDQSIIFYSIIMAASPSSETPSWRPGFSETSDETPSSKTAFSETIRANILQYSSSSS